MKTLLMSAALLGLNALADDIRLGVPGYGGTGCPAGTVSATLSTDAKTLSILFDQYLIEAGGMTGRTFDRKSCNVSIPVHVPQGFSVSLVQVDYRGYNNLPSGASSEFNVEYFFAGTRGPSYRRTFRGSLDANYTINNNLIATAQVWSRCGADVILRTNSNMKVQTNMMNEEAMSTVDSLDIEAGIIYRFQWRRCT